jgi:hypothetical protein
MHPRTIEINAIGSLDGRAARARPIAGELAALPARQAAQGGHGAHLGSVGDGSGGSGLAGGEVQRWPAAAW